MINSILNFNCANNGIQRANIQRTNIQKQQQNNPWKNIFNNSKLAPLAHDTISFGSNSSLNRALLLAWDNEQQCRMIYENAAIPMDSLRRNIRGVLNKYVADERNPHAPISRIMVRIKTPDSIREKVISEFENTLNEDISKIFDPRTEEGIKYGCNDLIGARVILRKADLNETTRITNELIKLVEQGKLNITQIENYVCKDGKTEYSYFQEKDLIRLRDAVNKNKKPGEKPIEFETKIKKSGYTALHLDVDLSSDDYKAKNNGYSGEIQFIGEDVSRLKDIEDLCYKIKLGKNIKNGNPAYAAFVDYFSKYLKDERYPDLDKDFLEYTARAYMFQRKKEPFHLNEKNKKNKDTSLPSVSQCKMDGKIPPELDYNKLAKIKMYCDKLYNLTKSV